jgi:hypothetical protein
VTSSDALIDAFLEGGVRTRALLRAQRPDALEAIRRELRESARIYQRGGELELPAPAVMISARKA